MKNSKQPSATRQINRFNIRNHALLGVLVVGLIVVVPALAATLPLPTSCTGTCGPAANLNFVQAGSATASTSGTAMTINQSSPTAILNWQNFNIDKGYSVNFVQPNIMASTLNKIWDTSPSTIAGSLTSTLSGSPNVTGGQIYLINHNGIIFGNGAQVNTGALVASSLDIDDTLFQAGYLTNTKLLPAFSGIGGFVRVDTGAELNGSRIMLFAPVVENSGKISTPGGQAVLAAGHKVYLEASQDPNLRGVLVEVDVNNPGAADPNLAATSLHPAQVQNNEAGTVSNFAGTLKSGILAERGNITLAGFAVNQQGRVSATTSVTENGSIKLLARYNVSTDLLATANQNANQNVQNAGERVYDIRATQTGKVTMATGSVTQVVPELADTSTNTDGQGFNPSIVEVMGNTINMQSGSSIAAPGGKVTLAAISSFDPIGLTGLNPAAGANGESGSYVYQEINKNLSYSSFFNPNYKPKSAASDMARVFMDSGSIIDVSGSQASVSVARNILTVQLRGSQLQDAPLQRTDRFLWGKDVLIDIRKGTPLANYAGEEAQIARTVAERTTSGGTVKLVSTGDVVMKSGAKIDLSGGQINYAGAYIKSTTLISNGVSYDIANAAPDRIYDGMFGSYTLAHSKWGINETFNTLAGGDSRGRWDPGYIEGKSAGALTVLAPHAVVNGDILAKTVAGSYQRLPFADAATLTANNYQNTWQMRPQGGSLVIGDSKAIADPLGVTNYTTDSDVTLLAKPMQLDNAFALFDPLSSNVAALPANFLQGIGLDANLFSTVTGLNRLGIYSNRTVSVTPGTSIQLAGGGEIALQGNAVNMMGLIDAPTGTVKMATAMTTASIGSKAGALSIGSAGTASHISTRGQWVNDAPQLGVPDLSKLLSINGGNITLSSGGDLLVAAGSLLDASGGAWLDTSNKLHGGNGGTLALSSGKSAIPFKAQLDGLDLRSYGTAGGRGGALIIKAGDIALGGTAAGAGTLVLPALFFNNGGFSSYNLTAQGLNGLTVTAGTVIEPKAQSLILDRTAIMQASGAELNTFAQIGSLPDWQRVPVSITLNQKNGGTLGLKVDTGAVIRLDPTASISLSAENQLTVLGTLDATAGSISLDLSATNTNYDPAQSIWLGSQSKLLSQGCFLKAQPNTQNLTQGKVLAGGKINITTNTGYVVAQPGSVMDVSGTSANLDLPQLFSGSLIYRSSHVVGDAGSISVQTGEGAFFDGNMNVGVEAGSQAAAGKFLLTLNNNPRFIDSTLVTYPLNPAQIQIMAGGNGGFISQAGFMPGNDANAGQVSLTALAGKAWLDAAALQKSGFEQVTLKSDDKIFIADQVNLQARRSFTLDAPQLVVSGNSTLSSAHVTLANTTNFQVTPNPVADRGILNVSGQLVDLIGNFTVSGANQLVIASSGDIRLSGIMDSTHTSLQGSLHTQGNISLQADQIYPTTLAQFKLSVEDSSGNSAGNITVLPGQHSPSPVMSAGGQLTLSAADIVQNGVVKAPMGMISLNASRSVSLCGNGLPSTVCMTSGAGSLTSVSADGQIIPFGLIQGGNAWVYDLTGTGNYITSISVPPQKQVQLTAPNIAIQNGATVNLAGGGDLYAYEFFAGSGGSVNVLDPAKAPANTFAILPGISGFAPYDPQYSGQYAQSGSKTILQSGGSVYLSGGTGVQAGYYTLLPASYALLPGAYRVTAVSGYTDRQPGQGATTLVDGTQIMAGKFAAVGTAIQDTRFSGFAVTSGAVVRTQSEYHDSYANAFFTTQANTNGISVPRSPVDAGQLIVSAVGNGAILAMDGTFNALPGTGGHGSLVDLNGPGFAIVNTKSPASGLVQLTTDSLNKLGADSLLIGGVRSQDAAGMNIAVGASQVVVDNGGSVLAGPEIILAAGNAVTVRVGSDIEGKGVSVGQSSNLDIGSASANGDGALLRVSSAQQVTVARTNLAAVPVQATLTVENGATVGTQNAVLLDSSYATTIGSNSVFKGQALSIAAQGIDVGRNSAPAVTSLSLSGTLLTQALTFKDLTLHSYNDINFYGTASLGGLDANQQHILNNLVLNSRSLNGLNNVGMTNVIDAANVMLLNNNNGTSTSTAYGAGNLKINADQIVLSDGNKSIQGFDTVTLVAAKQIVGQGTGNVTINAGDANVHNLLLQAGQITGTNKSNLTITAANDVISMQPVTGASPAVAEALNAKLTIIGKSIADNGVINLLSGSVTLHATGTAATDGVALGNGSRTVAAGISKIIAGQTAYAQAGSIALTADNGGVDIQGGAVVDVSGAAGGGDAGSLNIAATKGTVSVAGNLIGAASAAYIQGSFMLDSSSLVNSSGNALTGLNDILTLGSFNGLRDMRIRTGNLVLAADAPGTVRAKAHSFRLTGDAGTIDVLGTVDSSGASGGSILLAAKNNLTLNTGALLDVHATAAGQAGGKVALETLAGMIELNNQRIDVHGSGNTGGSVLLRAPRNAANSDVAVNNTGGAKLNVSPGANVTVEAFKTYTSVSGTLAAADVAATSVYNTDATVFAANATAIKTRLGVLADSNMHLAPGVEIVSASDLTLATDWDLSSWRFNDGNGGVTEPGILTLKAGGNLNFGSGTVTASLSDGVISSNPIIVKAGRGLPPTFTPLSGASWSYRLVAGADTSSADVMATSNTVLANTGNMVLAAGSEIPSVVRGTSQTAYTMEQIRTGTGFIDIAAGGNLSLGNRDSVIYTLGQPLTTVTGLPVALIGTNKHFGVNGGDISIRVKGDVNGAPTDQLITDWQWRQGAVDASGTITTQPAWWVNLGSFRQNIGTLGGGNVSVSASGNINNLSAVAPSTGYVDMVNPAHPTVVLGGGNLSVTASGAINSGVFYVGNGQGLIRAGGNLGASRWDINNMPLYTLLALGQGNFDVRAGGELNLQGVLNSTALSHGYSQNPPSVSKSKSFFFTFGDTSAVSLSSLSSNVSLNSTQGLFHDATNPLGGGFFNLDTTDITAATVYPGTLQINALGGNIISNNYISLFPSATGNMQFIAAKNIQLIGQIVMSDAALSSLQANLPTTSSDNLRSFINKGHNSIHAQDTRPAIISAGGSILGDVGGASLVLAKSAQIQAGQDVQNLILGVQNLNNSDTTSIVAGRDVVNTPVTVAGPGQVVLQAGHNVDLGQSTGVTTTGNLTNLLLPEQGADVTVLAGVGQGATAAQAFIDKYINPVVGKSYGSDLITYVGNYGAPQNQTADQAFAYFNTLPKPLQDTFVRQVLFSELRQSGRSAASKGNYQAGFDAIAALFPAGGYKGDVNLYYSQIKTMRGGSISLLTPGGGINAGLANPSATGPQKTAAELGIVTVKGGDVNAFVNNDFMVNQSRVFTLQGGNILMWSSSGNIDAGKGSKSVSSTPPPLLIVDPKTGAFNVDVTQSVVGSGIRVLLANKNVVPGSVDLFAPSGEINAGDAGIGAAGNIFLGALRVVGADNINFGGTSVGVPVAAPAPVNISGMGNMQDAGKAAEEATQNMSNASEMAKKNLANFRPTFLSVEVIGLGNESMSLQQ